jgi:hypothetical protein
MKLSSIVGETGGRRGMTSSPVRSMSCSKIKRAINGQSLERRSAIRQELITSLIADLAAWICSRTSSTMVASACPTMRLSAAARYSYSTIDARRSDIEPAFMCEVRGDGGSEVRPNFSSLEEAARRNHFRTTHVGLDQTAVGDEIDSGKIPVTGNGCSTIRSPRGSQPVTLAGGGARALTHVLLRQIALSSAAARRQLGQQDFWKTFDQPRWVLLFLEVFRVRPQTIISARSVA